MFGAMLSEWSWLTFRGSKLIPTSSLSTGPPQTSPVFHLSPSQSANPRCLQFRPLPAPHSASHQTPASPNRGVAQPPAREFSLAHTHTRSPGCQAANQRAAVRIRALSDSWNLPDLHLADAAHHRPLTTEVKLLLLPCVRRRPPKRM